MGDCAQPRAQGDPLATRFAFQRIGPVAVVDVGRKQINAVTSGVAGKHLRGVETHRLLVEEGAVESRGVILLEIERLVGDEGEAGRVGLAEAVAGKAGQLVEDRSAAVSRSMPRWPARLQGSGRASPPWPRPSDERDRARRSISASPGEKPAAATATRIACSWKSSTPLVSASTGSRQGCR